MTDEWQLAQLNVATALFPPEDPRIHDFYAQLDEINALADASPGFIWRLQSDTGNATDIQVGDDPLLIVNMSVWQSVEALSDFAYRSAHRKVVANRKQWFSRPGDAYQVLWWVPAGNQPSVDEGMARLDLLRSAGAGPNAFTFKTKFPAPGQAGEPKDLKTDPFCSGWE